MANLTEKLGMQKPKVRNRSLKLDMRPNCATKFIAIWMISQALSTPDHLCEIRARKVGGVGYTWDMDAQQQAKAAFIDRQIPRELTHLCNSSTLSKHLM
jgi:hypothetical protein